MGMKIVVCLGYPALLADRRVRSRGQGYATEAVNDIIRINIRRLLRNMDEPEKEIKTPELEKASTAKGNRDELNDILARTLEHKLDTSASKEE